MKMYCTVSKLKYIGGDIKTSIHIGFVSDAFLRVQKFVAACLLQLLLPECLRHIPI